MLNNQTLSKLAELIKIVIEAETKLEHVKLILSQQQCFEPFTCFSYIDQNQSQQLVKEDLKNFLQKNRTQSTDEELNYLLQKLDSNGDGFVTFSDFLSSIIPQMARTKYETQSSKGVNYELAQEVKWGLTRVFQQMISNQNFIKNAIKILFANKQIDFLKIIEKIDKKQKGHLNLYDQSINDFLYDQERFVSNDELKLFCQKMDKESNGKIKYEDLLNQLIQKPIKKENKSPTSYVEKIKYEANLRRNTDIKIVYTNSLKRKSSNKGSLSQQRNRQTSPSRQNSPMKGNEETHLVAVLKEQIALQRGLEQLKAALSMRSDFHPSSAFRLLDKAGRGQITKLEFELACNDISIFPTHEQISLFYDHYSPNSGFLNYKSFLNACLPLNSEYQQIMINRNPNEEIKNKTKELIKSFLRQHLQTEKINEILRQKLNSRRFFNLTKAFNAIDRTDQGFINLESLQSLFSMYGINATDEELENLMHIYDKNFDGKISYSEFIRELSPRRSCKN